ncbi:hypothetical protein SAMN06296065_101222 [Novosphingobium panipatense]|jgi:hypothetical protein|uniref:Uncharacterized protein n=1 Tax=Novosphingobium panipatense TaxID=428991 RepID=A0ABY1Q1Z0_9SPHN|nr:hypothetical protein SAMN06296065_101222 [Novosphingobium panipatense]
MVRLRRLQQRKITLLGNLDSPERGEVRGEELAVQQCRARPAQRRH